MSTAIANDLYDCALRLPLDERRSLVDALLVSIESESETPLDESWLAEIRRRSAEIEAGTAKTVPWEEVKKQARAKVGLNG